MTLLTFSWLVTTSDGIWWVLEVEWELVLQLPAFLLVWFAVKLAIRTSDELPSSSSLITPSSYTDAGILGEPSSSSTWIQQPSRQNKHELGSIIPFYWNQLNKNTVENKRYHNEMQAGKLSWMTVTHSWCPIQIRMRPTESSLSKDPAHHPQGQVWATLSLNQINEIQPNCNQTESDFKSPSYSMQWHLVWIQSCIPTLFCSSSLGKTIPQSSPVPFCELVARCSSGPW